MTYKRIPISSRMIDISGQRFGRLIAQYPVASKRPTDWFCLCDCGGNKVVRQDQLKSGNNKSCGCLGIEYLKSSKQTCLRHGLSHTKVHRTWTAIRNRCTNPNIHNYHNYGGRGIRVCKRWDSFECFLDDMGMPPTDKHSIERIDNDAGYTPENCHWIPLPEQALNKNTSHMITYNGKTQCLMQWATCTF